MRAARGIGAATTVCTLHPKRSNASAAARAKLIRGAIPYDTGKVVRALLKRADHLVLAGGLKGGQMALTCAMRSAEFWRKT